MAKTTISVLTYSIWYTLYDDPYKAVALFHCGFSRYTWEPHDPLYLTLTTPKGDFQLPI